MSDARTQITALLVQIEHEAYARGYSDAIAAVTKAATEAAVAAPKPNVPIESFVVPPSIVVAPRRGRPASKAIARVQDLIAAKPGLKGVEVARALATGETPVIERTVRSCLRRLRESKVIWQRKGRWYPRDRADDIAGTAYDFGEVRETPPH